MADMQKIMELKAQAFDITNQMNYIENEKQKLVQKYNELVMEIDRQTKDFQENQKKEGVAEKLDQAKEIQSSKNKKENKSIEIPKKDEKENDK